MGLTAVAQQPKTAEEIILAKAAAEDCPTNSIGMNG
jgi:hypothetical protein